MIDVNLSQWKEAQRSDPLRSSKPTTTEGKLDRRDRERDREREQERDRQTETGSSETKRVRDRNSRKSVTWSAVPDAPMLVYVGMR